MAASELNVSGPHGLEQERKRRVRRSALWLALLAVAFYLGFIAMSVKMAHG